MYPLAKHNKRIYSGNATVTEHNETQNFFLLVDEGIQYHQKGAIIGMPAKRHLNGVLLVCQWWHSIECWLGSCVIFQGVHTIIAKKPYIFVIFQGRGVRTPMSPLPRSPHISATVHKASNLLKIIISKSYMIAKPLQVIWIPSTPMPKGTFFIHHHMKLKPEFYSF